MKGITCQLFLPQGSSDPLSFFLRAKLDGPYDSRGLPILLSCLMVLSMSIVFGGAFLRISETPATP